MRRVAVIGGWVVLCASLSLTGCDDGQTAIRVRILAGAAPLPELESVHLRVAPEGRRPDQEHRIGLQADIPLRGEDAASLPIAVVIEPLGGDASHRVDIAVRPNGCVGALDRAIVAFSQGNVVDVTMRLDCCPEECPADTRCMAPGVCIEWTLPDGGIDVFDGGPSDGSTPGMDADAPFDAAPSDGHASDRPVDDGAAPEDAPRTWDAGSLPARCPAATFGPLAVGDHHACVVRSGELYCWGSNSGGQILIASTGAPEQVSIPGAGVFTSLAAGSRHTCGVADGRLFCWGTNILGQLGAGDERAHPTPVVVALPGGEPVDRVVAGGDSTCALSSTARLYCWGDNRAAQLGLGDFSRRNAPTAVAPGQLFSLVQISVDHACGIAFGPGGGELHCWGSNIGGKLGDGTAMSRSRPTPVVGGPASWTDVALGAGHSCGVGDGGTLYCWGDNTHGQTGIVGSSRTPRTVPGSAVELLAAAEDSTCTIGGGILRCGGENDVGQLGLALGPGDVPTFMAVAGGAWTAIAISEHYTPFACGVHASHLYCWGDNSSGEVGNGTTMARFNAPEEVCFP